LAVEELADEFLKLLDDLWIEIVDRLGELFDDSVGLGGEGCREGIAIFHAPTLQNLVNIELLRGRHSSGAVVAIVFDGQIPVNFSIACHSHALVAVIREGIGEFATVGEGEIVIDIRAYD
jgi:hypothetical protein